MATPVQHFEAVRTAIAKEEQVAGERVSLQARRDQVVQSIKTQTHIYGVAAIPEFDGRRQAQHVPSPRTVTRERIQARSQPGSRRSTAPLGRTSSTSAPEVCSRTGSSRGSPAPL